MKLNTIALAALGAAALTIGVDAAAISNISNITNRDIGLAATKPVEGVPTLAIRSSTFATLPATAVERLRDLSSSDSWESKGVSSSMGLTTFTTISTAAVATRTTTNTVAGADILPSSLSPSLPAVATSAPEAAAEARPRPPPPNTSHGFIPSYEDITEQIRGALLPSLLCYISACFVVAGVLFCMRRRVDRKLDVLVEQWRESQLELLQQQQRKENSDTAPTTAPAPAPAPDYNTTAASSQSQENQSPTPFTRETILPFPSFSDVERTTPRRHCPMMLCLHYIGLATACTVPVLGWALVTWYVLTTHKLSQKVKLLSEILERAAEQTDESPRRTGSGGCGAWPWYGGASDSDGGGGGGGGGFEGRPASSAEERYYSRKLVVVNGTPAPTSSSSSLTPSLPSPSPSLTTTTTARSSSSYFNPYRVPPPSRSSSLNSSRVPSLRRTTMTTSSLRNHYSYNNNRNNRSNYGNNNNTSLSDDDRPLTPAGTLTSVEQEVLDSQLRIADPIAAAPPRGVLVPYDHQDHHHHHRYHYPGNNNNNYYYNYNNEATTDEEQGDVDLVYYSDEPGSHNNASSLLAQDLGFAFRRPLPPVVLANPRLGRTAGRFSLDD